MFIKKYTLPLSIFLVHEKTFFTVWFSKNINPNVFIYMGSDWIMSINKYLKNDVTYYNTTLIEQSAVDNKNYNIFKTNYKNNKKRFLIVFYQYYMYTIRLRLTLLLINNFNKKLKSIDSIFKSAGWLERESSEMFKVNYTNKIDIRTLLLDYSKQENPMLKDYNVEGNKEYHYSFFSEQVIFQNLNSVEL